MRRPILPLLLCLLTTPALAATVSWDRNTDPYTVGYRLYYGTASGSYQWSLDVGNEVSAPVQLSAGTYYFTVRAYNAALQYGPAALEATFTQAPPPQPVNCQGTWSAWLPLIDWSVCTNGVQSRTESHSFVVSVYPRDGGLACPTSPETRTVTRACTPPPTDPCVSSPNRPQVLTWPKKNTALRTYSPYPATVSTPPPAKNGMIGWVTFTETTRACQPITIFRN